MSTFDLVLVLFAYVVGRDLGRIAWLMVETRRVRRETEMLEQRIMDAELRDILHG